MTTSRPEPVLVVSNLSVRYGGIHALKDVSLEVVPGEVVALLGANGAGKSTLLKTIVGLLHPATGSVVLNGQRIDDWRPARRARAGLALVPEGRRILSRMSVEENLLIGAYARSDGEAATRATLAQVMARFPLLAERRAQSGGSLSGGEQQLLAIGRALMARPTVLLLDEPSLGLAPRLVRDMFRIVADLRMSGLTILLVEQNARQSLRVADRAYVLESGSVVASGAAVTLLQSNHIREAYLGSTDFEREPTT